MKDICADYTSINPFLNKCIYLDRANIKKKKIYFKMIVLSIGATAVLDKAPLIPPLNKCKVELA